MELDDVFVILNHLLTNKEQTWEELKNTITSGGFLPNDSHQLLVNRLTFIEEALLKMKVKFPSQDIRLKDTYDILNTIHEINH